MLKTNDVMTKFIYCSKSQFATMQVTKAFKEHLTSSLNPKPYNIALFSRMHVWQ